MSERKYMVDNETVDWGQLIKMAEDYGYEGEGGIYYTSGAAKVLRENGFTVCQYQAEEVA